MTALPDVLRDDPQVAVTILTTERYQAHAFDMGDQAGDRM
jgi:hypothetical protein